MATKTSLRITMTDIAKLIGATILFFLGLTIGAQKAGLAPSVIKIDYLQEEIDAEQHGSPLEPINQSTSLEFYCSHIPGACEKIVYSGDLSAEDRVGYSLEYLGYFFFIKNKLSLGIPFDDVFKTLVLNAGEGGRRGSATRNKITINISSLFEKKEFGGVLTHEFGHIVDLGALQGTHTIKNGNYTEFDKIIFSIDDPSLEYYAYSRDTEHIRKTQAKKDDFCSGYGMSNPFEDFAECFNLYLNHNQLFKTMALKNSVMKNKYNYLANLFENNYIHSGERKLPYLSWRPWDTTKLY